MGRNPSDRFQTSASTPAGDRTGWKSDRPLPEVSLETADLRQAEVDIAIRLGRPSEPELLIRLLGDISYGLYGAASWFQRSEDQRVYLGFDASMPDLPQKLWLEEIAVDAPILIRSNDLGTLLASCLAGHGVALLPDFIARHHTSLLRLPSSGANLARSAFLVMHPDKRRSARVKVTADCLVDVISRELRLR